MIALVFSKVNLIFILYSYNNEKKTTLRYIEVHFLIENEIFFNELIIHSSCKISKVRISILIIEKS